ncbi:MAG: hypothetical protein ACM3SO_16380 [Betaproteobacteria bacterium]
MDHEYYPYYFNDNVRREERVGYLIANAIASAWHAIRRAFSAGPGKRTA